MTQNFINNNKCYRFDVRNYNKGFLDDFVDCTYILQLENNGRMKNIEQQLSRNIPTKKIYIVHNKGYKNCTKNLIEYNSKNDLVDANLIIMKHSIDNNFNNILILEDDFIFDYDRINDTKKNIVNDIKLFFNKNKNEKFYYNLGPSPLIIYPNINISNKNYKCATCFVAHANIYTKNIRIDILNKINNRYNISIHWDIFLTRNYKNYFHKYSICYQTFPITENQKMWQEGIFSKFFFYITTKGIKLLNYDKKSQPAHDIVMNSIFILNYIIYFLIIIIIFYLVFLIFFKYKK
jgi:hypothetical protein